MSTYQDYFDNLHYSDQTKQKMKGWLVEHARTTHINSAMDILELKPKAKHHSFAAAAAIVFALLIGTSGVAYATGNLGRALTFIDTVFNGAPAETRVVEHIGRPLDAQVSDAGITVSAEAIIGDRSSYAVIYSLEKDDGTAFDTTTSTAPYLPYVMDNALQTDDVALFARGISGATGESYFFDENPDDNAIQYVEKYNLMSENASASIVGATVNTGFSGLLHEDDQGHMTPIAEGNWNLRFTLDYEDLSHKVPVAGEKFSLSQCEATITDMHISPLSLSFSYVADSPAYFDDEPSGKMSDSMAQESARLLDCGDIVVTMKDGSTIVQKDMGGGTIASDKSTCQKNQFFDSIIDVDEVASITIGGTCFEVSES
ncbi:MAG: DUF4179 domain-containing protein [Atopobiaceae bacterium]|nr:DUF4179 domain-containing protein [Atopobiaceae bacterium]